MISIVIPTRSRYGNLKNTLEAVFSQSCTTFEVVISDDNSTDETQSVINQFKNRGRLKYVFNNYKPESWNASIPRNLGALVADPNTDGYYFIDSDVVIPPVAVQTVIDDYNIESSRVVIGPYHWWNKDGSGVLQQDVRWPKFDSVVPEATFELVTDGLACFGGNIFIPRKIFWSVRGFSVDTSIGLEDGDMGLKLWKQKTKFSYDKRLLGRHQWHETPPDRFPRDMKKHIDALNIKHFNNVNPDYGIIEASRDAYASWGITGWEAPKEWMENKLSFGLEVNHV